ncbi:MAG TPA: hypothetical protein VHJ18_30025 [Streptosporangiaceae bacterium]|jgi:hypothetical protein|nr:hypothetical protein [Streptosporangiaceae bacterium]
MQRQVTGALVATVVVFLAAGCGSAGSGGSARIATPACPAGAPPSATPGTSAGHRGLVRSDPVSVAICQYGAASHSSRGNQGNHSSRRARAKSGFRPLRRIVLGARAATGLAALVNSAGPLTPRARSCGQLPSAQFLVFGYATGSVSRVAVQQLTCDLAVVTAGWRSGVLTLSVASDLFAITMVPRHPRGPRTPRLLGLSAARAVDAARRQHFTVYFDGSAIDPAARTGTVIFQSLPAGLPDSLPGHQVDVITAVRQSPPCIAGQLALTYLGGEPATGNDFGTLLVTDRSRHACALPGPLRVTGLDTRGVPVTSTVSFPLVGTNVLSPGAGPITRTRSGRLSGIASGELIGVLHLQAEYRDGPANVDNGLCTPLWVTPATWRVRLPGGQAITTVNSDLTNSFKLAPSGGLVTCRGQLGGDVPETVGSFP